MEPGTELIIRCSAEILQKLLGPTADYLGGEIKSYTEKGLNYVRGRSEKGGKGEIKSYTEKGLENITIIFKAAIKKLGSKIETDGQVPPRILKEILDEGYFCEDELASEYFGGVLA